jgi:hypothetical protein
VNREQALAMNRPTQVKCRRCKVHKPAHLYELNPKTQCRKRVCPSCAKHELLPRKPPVIMPGLTLPFRPDKLYCGPVGGPVERVRIRNHFDRVPV